MSSSDFLQSITLVFPKGYASITCIPSVEFSDPETCRVLTQRQGGLCKTSLGRTRKRFRPSRPWSPRQSLFCSSFHWNRECRILSRPLLVHLLFRAVVDDTGTPYSISRYRTSLLFMREQLRVEGFSPLRTQRHQVHFSASASSVLLFSLSFLCFEARRFIHRTSPVLFSTPLPHVINLKQQFSK